jgi:hypothetical protein
MSKKSDKEKSTEAKKTQTSRKYEPPKLKKFEKLEKLILSGE